MKNNKAHEQVREEAKTQKNPRKPMGRPAKEPYRTRRWEVQLPFDLDKCLEELAPGSGFDLMKEIVRDNPRIHAWIREHEEELEPFRRPQRRAKKE